MQGNPPSQAADELTLEQSAARRLFVEQQRREELLWLVNEPLGRRFLWRLFDESGLLGVTTPEHTEAQVRFFEGRRHFAQGLMALVHKHCINRYPQMVSEAALNNERIDAASR